MKFTIVPVFKFFDILRRVILNLIFWGIVIIIAAVYVKNTYMPEVAPGSVLMVRPTGYIIEHTSSDTADFISGDDEDNDTTLRALLAVLDEAAKDSSISAMFLDLRRFNGSGLSKLQEIAIAVKKVRDSGKKVVAFSNTYSQGKYYIASHAENIVIDPLGEMMFTGIGDFHNYFGKGFKKFGIGINVFRAGEYKSAVEPYTSDKMSVQAREASENYMGDLWNEYLAAVSKERNITRKNIDKYISDYAVILEKYKGNSAETAKANKIVDTIGVYEDAVNIAGTGKQIEWKDYYKAIKKREKSAQDKIAVVIASGTIVPGTQPPGTIGSSSYVTILDNIKEDKKVSAVVLRIDSGGGSVGASEDIRRALQKVRETGKPVVVSMSSVAASGAYWISTASDSILCMPSTLTGSIGVFGMLPDISVFLDRYPGITTDGYGTTKFSSFYRPDISLTEDMKKILTLSVENDYSKFLNLVSSGRDIQLSETRKIAGGRVWSGRAAISRKLADRAGTLEDAIVLAAEKSGVTNYSVDYYEPKENLRSSISRGLGAMAASVNKSIGDNLYDFITEALLFHAGKENNSDLFFENIFNGSQSLYMGPEFIFR